MVAAEMFEDHLAGVARARAERQKRVVLVVGDDRGVDRPRNRAARAYYARCRRGDSILINSHELEAAREAWEPNRFLPGHPNIGPRLPVAISKPVNMLQIKTRHLLSFLRTTSHSFSEMRSPPAGSALVVIIIRPSRPT